jgi:hypothetical protein
VQYTIFWENGKTDHVYIQYDLLQCQKSNCTKAATYTYNLQQKADTKDIELGVQGSLTNSVRDLEEPTKLGNTCCYVTSDTRYHVVTRLFLYYAGIQCTTHGRWVEPL